MSRRLKSRLADLEEQTDADIAPGDLEIHPAWAKDIPSELWDDLAGTWKWSLTSGDSHPELENDPDVFIESENGGRD